MKPTVVILAAGLGTRMKSGLAKALHPLAGKPLVRHVLDTVASLDPEKIVVVVGHQAEAVSAAAAGPGIQTAIQSEQLGTGHAVLQARTAIEAASGPVLILCADTPLIMPDTLRSLLSIHEKKRAAITLLTASVQDPFGYGRIVRTGAMVMRVVEEKDATAAQKKIREVNAGVYCVDGKFLLSALASVGNKNAQGEYYLPDAVAAARKLRHTTAALIAPDPLEVLGVNTRYDLSLAEGVLRQRTNRRWMLAGVTMPEPDRVFIGTDVVLGTDTTLYPGVRIEGATSVGQGCDIYPGTRITDSVIGSTVTIKDHCVIEQSTVADGASVGPFAHLRPGSDIGIRARIGNFVEIKKSIIGEGSKVNHLSYIGDATVGKGVNIGAGVITCNYDGFEKHRTEIGDDVFVGSDAQLVAPVRIGAGALIAAGATITRDVPPDALGVSRAPQEIREGFAARRRKMKQKIDGKPK
ncbi:MAG: UDP-N-acetylglucosamine diphosphorylase/glucosamine-1-phosphate N-acetyltransferase [Nitrospirae bacterium GWC2_57_13]|jgi:bifunctional UDP-N-acetylglucosamine pyrophosphorylase / glucosamine-1-phosphate N-acetyltransferase|nr:MAG: UDP-N-acetylglucosamine diphosphorylase/glucosamine-1-phosphate N-acetyltransferase [Nitrospirae bacterium GWC1_57_7]OGW27573.1 MAG: UDP-N-acetylglucosamine diphosphorylase/glucosamine-1-phosphate N-acetyltransferase [Nitrospirae bacterium GWC2_57_13]OGW44374.1 MAG: UDP-N-acetylglucosamine diphosphorylase/glucosamine-1-phosphate N-acetyltransferase [Nitrospirae bacterium GWD2_57_8]HAR45286.1 bifunctional UDP-N-acetylglucosamine diphosphorylase/glucosamine-1-phosphate N-acetyltransferase 